jgi:two-component system CheB/CheR fusion protein
VQHKVLSRFHFALNRNGIAFLGPSESPGLLLNDFETLDKHWRIYRKVTDGKPLMNERSSSGSRGGLAIRGTQPSLPRYAPSSMLGTYDALLEEFIPPSVLINESGELVHTFGGANQFLKVREGRVGLDLLEMVSPHLKMILLGALPRARRQAEPVILSGVRASDDQPDQPFKITVRQLRPRGPGGHHMLVSFESVEAEPLPTRSAAEVALDQASSDQLNALAQELTYTKESLHAASEELQTTNEELQTTNEELLASNEELQSTNEELQSVNEELYTVNAEYQRKITDLTELSNDMENLLASTEVGTIFLDRQLRIRKFTSKVADSFNLMPQDVGRPISAFSTRMDYPQLSTDLERVLRTGVPVECEVRDGMERPSFLRILPYRAKGTIDGVVLTLIDVSAMKATEDALFHERYLLNSLLSSVPDAIYFRDAKGRFIRTNEAMARRLGVGEPKELVGKGVADLRGTKLSQAVQQLDEAVLESGQAEHYRLEQRTGSDGNEEWDLATRLPLLDAADRVVGVVGILRDVTEQKQAEHAIQEAVRRRDEFLAMLSHELRNPLASVVSATALLKQRRHSPEKQGRVLDILERQSRQMGRLLDDLLDVSRVTQDKIELRKELLDLNHVVQEAVEGARGLFEARGLTLQLKLASESLMLLGDPARLQQIHTNLLNNAAKYTPRGGHVQVETRLAGDSALVTVRDDGLGIPPALQSSIFDLFVQSTRTLDRSDGGLGVGLTLVRGLVAKHGGTITVLSEGEGKGSEFELRFPLQMARETSRPPRAPLRRAPVPRGQRVVLIEDNEDSRHVLCELLSSAGFECHEAGDGLHGLALIDTLRPELAVVDIGLPGLDGHELARRVKANPAHKGITMLALTGYGQREDREEALRAGFDHHLVKPVDFAALMRVLADHMPDAAEQSPPCECGEGDAELEG